MVLLFICLVLTFVALKVYLTYTVWVHFGIANLVVFIKVTRKHVDLNETARLHVYGYYLLLSNWSIGAAVRLLKKYHAIRTKNVIRTKTKTRVTERKKYCSIKLWNFKTGSRFHWKKYLPKLWVLRSVTMNFVKAIWSNNPSKAASQIPKRCDALILKYIMFAVTPIGLPLNWTKKHSMECWCNLPISPRSPLCKTRHKTFDSPGRYMCFPYVSSFCIFEFVKVSPYKNNFWNLMSLPLHFALHEQLTLKRYTLFFLSKPQLSLYHARN